MPMAMSLFLKDRLLTSEIETTLLDHFPLSPDPHGYGWAVEVQPDRYVIVEDGTEDIPTMPDEMITPAARVLGGRFRRSLPAGRLVLMFNQDNPDGVEEQGAYAIGRV